MKYVKYTTLYILLGSSLFVTYDSACMKRDREFFEENNSSEQTSDAKYRKIIDRVPIFPDNTIIQNIDTYSSDNNDEKYVVIYKKIQDLMQQHAQPVTLENGTEQIKIEFYDKITHALLGIMKDLDESLSFYTERNNIDAVIQTCAIIQYFLATFAQYSEKLEREEFENCDHFIDLFHDILDSLYSIFLTLYEKNKKSLDSFIILTKKISDLIKWINYNYDSSILELLNFEDDFSNHLQNLLILSKPIHWATYEENLDLVKFLVEEAKFDVDTKNQLGTTPLFYACYNKDIEMCKYLLSKGANIDHEHGVCATPTAYSYITLINPDQEEEKIVNDMEKLIGFFITHAHITIKDILEGYAYFYNVYKFETDIPLHVLAKIFDRYHTEILQDKQFLSDMLLGIQKRQNTPLTIEKTTEILKIATIIHNNSSYLDDPFFVYNFYNLLPHIFHTYLNNAIKIREKAIKDNNASSTILMQKELDEYYQKLLYTASKHNDIKTIQELLLLYPGIDPNVTNKEGLTAIDQLVRKDHRFVQKKEENPRAHYFDKTVDCFPSIYVLHKNNAKINLQKIKHLKGSAASSCRRCKLLEYIENFEKHDKGIDLLQECNIEKQPILHMFINEVAYILHNIPAQYAEKYKSSTFNTNLAIITRRIIEKYGPFIIHSKDTHSSKSALKSAREKKLLAIYISMLEIAKERLDSQKKVFAEDNQSSDLRNYFFSMELLNKIRTMTKDNSDHVVAYIQKKANRANKNNELHTLFTLLNYARLIKPQVNFRLQNTQNQNICELIKQLIIKCKVNIFEKNSKNETPFNLSYGKNFDFRHILLEATIKKQWLKYFQNETLRSYEFTRMFIKIMNSPENIKKATIFLKELKSIEREGNNELHLLIKFKQNITRFNLDDHSLFRDTAITELIRHLVLQEHTSIYEKNKLQPARTPLELASYYEFSSIKKDLLEAQLTNMLKQIRQENPMLEDDNTEHRYKGQTCIICLDSIGSLQEFIAIKPCKHALHEPCFINYYKEGTNGESCPFCRETIQGIQKIKLIPQDKPE